MIDYHIHTSISDDSDAPYTIMAEQAIKLGLKEIAITDHHDPEYVDPDFPFDLDFDAYKIMLEAAHQKYYKSINVVKGIELGVNSLCYDACRESARRYPYDFIIGSFHMTNGKLVDAQDFYMDRPGIEIQEEYYRYALECVKNFKDYNVIGHINLVDRYMAAFRPEEKLCPEEIMEIIREVLKVVIYDGKGIEFNTSAYRYNTPITLPAPAILKAYKELGGEILTIGSDAHSPDYIACGFKSALEAIEAEGFKYISTFKAGKPDFVKISHL